MVNEQWGKMSECWANVEWRLSERWVNGEQMVANDEQMVENVSEWGVIGNWTVSEGWVNGEQTVSEQ